MREKGQTEVAKTLETPVFSRGIEILTEKIKFLAGNISDNKKLVVSSSDVDIKVKPDRLDIMRTKVIEGRQCLVIELNGTVSVNGIPVRTVIRK